ncbi:putative phage tail protein [Paenibacillus sp. 2RAB27]|uniref:putative phage tail protein n=1 Tax=Paenibacillus sp. 2RAB27 TaxID=3232991 RepID=UPI003F9B7C94
MSFSDSLYGANQYGVNETDTAQTNDENPDLMKYLPAYYHEILDMRCIQESLSADIGKLNIDIRLCIDQFFIDTATWGLDFWERVFGISTDRTKSYEPRREVIKAKIRGAGTTTKEMIRTTAMAFSGGEVNVIDYPTEYRFEVQFVGVKGIPQNMAGFIAMLEEIKPAHLTYSFKYTYTTWDNLKILTWQQVHSKTWNQLKVYEGE